MPVRPRCSARTSNRSRRANRYGLDPFYELHAWLWKPNPSGFLQRLEPAGLLLRPYGTWGPNGPPCRGGSVLVRHAEDLLPVHLADHVGMV